MRLRCWLKGHEPLRLNAMGKQPLITIKDITGDLVRVELCIHCRGLYWEATQQRTAQQLRQADALP